MVLLYKTNFGIEHEEKSITDTLNNINYYIVHYENKINSIVSIKQYMKVNS